MIKFYKEFIGTQPDSSKVIEYVKNRNKIIPDEIIIHFLSKHISCDYLFEEFDWIDLSEVRIVQKYFTTDEVKKFEYANFVDLRDEPTNLKMFTPIINGTFDFPILVVKNPMTSTYVVIDGNNRFRYFLHSENLIEKHIVNCIEF